MLYAFYIYTRDGTCLYQKKWHIGKLTSTADPEEEKRLLFGLLFSLKEFVHKMSPALATGQEESTHGIGSRNGDLQRYQTDKYICHHYETASGYRFILLSDTLAGDLSGALRHIHTNIFVQYVINNPLYEPGKAKTIDNQLFQSNLHQYLDSLPGFR